MFEWASIPGVVVRRSLESQSDPMSKTNHRHHSRALSQRMFTSRTQTRRRQRYMYRRVRHRVVERVARIGSGRIQQRSEEQMNKREELNIC